MNPFGFPVDVSLAVEGGKWWLVGWDNSRIYPSPTNRYVWLGSRERWRFQPL